EPSAILFISSIVSPCIIVLIISLLISLNIKRPIHIYCRLQSADSSHILNEKEAGKCPLHFVIYSICTYSSNIRPYNVFTPILVRYYSARRKALCERYLHLLPY